MTAHLGSLPPEVLRARAVVVLSGAGISTDSGIPDFRGPTGAWTLDPKAREHYTFQLFRTDPSARRDFWEERRASPAWTAKPNPGHLAVAELANAGILTAVITQNTDGLHQRAGTPSERVIELHGSMHTTVCIDCDERTSTIDILARIDAGELAPECRRCGGLLKTATVMAGQVVDPVVFERARDAVANCDLLLAVGTTLEVEPPASLCAAALGLGAAVIIVNRDPTPYDSIASLVVRDPLSEALPRIVAELLTAEPRPGAAPRATGGTVVAPVQLLRADARTVRFRSRVAELEDLRSWCAGTGVRVQLVTGVAGRGKTRLALALADELAASGAWAADFVSELDDPPAGGAERRLVIVDNAEYRTEQVLRILRAAHADPGGTLRLLLLARGQGEWWARMCAEGSAQGLWAATTAEELGPLERTQAGREEAFDEAFLDYRAAIASTAPASAGAAGAPRPDLGDGRFESPGWLHLAALAAAIGEPADGLSVADVALRHELSWLEHSAVEQAPDLPADLVGRAVGAMMLCGAADESAALAILGQALGPKADDVREQAARWLSGLGPAYLRPAGGRPYWDVVLPDLLGEFLIGSAASAPGFLATLLMESTEAQDEHALVVLFRAAATHPRLSEALTGLLSVLPGLSPAAVRTALHSGQPEPLADALTSLAHTAALPFDLVDAIPPGTKAIAGFAIALLESLVVAYESRVERNPRNILPGMAQLLERQAHRWSDLGRHHESLMCTQRAAACYARLAQLDAAGSETPPTDSPLHPDPEDQRG